MFNAHQAVDFPALNGIVVRLYAPTLWGRCTGKRHRWTLRVEDTTHGPFKVIDAGSVVVLTPGQEYGITVPGSFVLYSDDEGLKCAKFSAVFNTNTDDELVSSLYDNQTRENISRIFFANGDYREVRRDNAW